MASYLALVLPIPMAEEGMGGPRVDVYDVDQDGGPRDVVATRPILDDRHEEALWDNLVDEMGFRRTEGWGATDSGYAAALTTAYGVLYDADTGESIGVATRAQAEASYDDKSGETGLFLMDADGDPVSPGSWGAQQPGTRTVYVL